MTDPKVSIITLNWNGLDDTIELLESLKLITYPNYEIIIVDNASSGNDVAILREKYGYIRLIANDKNYGFPEGCNIGMREAMASGSDYFLLLNNDTIVEKEFLSEMVTIAESSADIGIVGSKIYYYHKPDILQAAGGKIRWWLGIIQFFGNEKDSGQYDKNVERNFVPGTSFLIKKSVIEKISLMDPFYLFGVEEIDYCTRAKQAGFRIVYAPKSKVWHKQGASRAKISLFPETKKSISASSGPRDSKYYYRIFKTYLPPLLFLIPFVLNFTALGYIIMLIQRGKWKAIFNRNIA